METLIKLRFFSPSVKINQDCKSAEEKKKSSFKIKVKIHAYCRKSKDILYARADKTRTRLRH